MNTSKKRKHLLFRTFVYVLIVSGLWMTGLSSNAQIGPFTSDIGSNIGSIAHTAGYSGLSVAETKVRKESKKTAKNYGKRNKYYASLLIKKEIERDIEKIDDLLSDIRANNSKLKGMVSKIITHNKHEGDYYQRQLKLAEDKLIILKKELSRQKSVVLVKDKINLLNNTEQQLRSIYYMIKTVEKQIGSSSHKVRIINQFAPK